MSENEMHIGKLEYFEKRSGEEDMAFHRRLFETLNIDFNPSRYVVNKEDYLRDELYEQVFFVDGKVFINKEHKEFEDNYACELHGNMTDGFTYFMSFYNGGTCLSAMVEETLSKKLKPDYKGYVEHLKEAEEKGIPINRNYLSELNKLYNITEK